MNPEPTAVNSAGRASGWLAAALIVLPFLQALPIDLDRTAPLLLLPALWLGRRELGAAVASWGEAKPWIQLSLGLTILGVALSVMFAVHQAPALVMAATWVVLGAAAVLASRLVQLHPGAGRRLLAGIAVGAAAGTVAVWLLWSGQGGGRMPLYAHHRHLGLHTIAGAVATTVLLLRAEGRAARLGWFAAGALTWGGLLWSGGRAPLVAVIGSLAAWFWLQPGPGRTRLAQWSAAQLAAGLALSAAFWTTQPELGWWHAFRRTASATQTRSVSQLTSTRNEFWREAAAHAASTPWLGRGPDAYRYLVPKLDGQQPHNLVLQLWLDLGLVGGIPALALLAGGIVAGAKAWRKGGDPEADWAAMLIALAAAAMLDGVFYHVLTLLPASLALGIVLRPVASEVTPASTMFTRVLPTTAVAVATAVLAVHAALFHALAVAAPPAGPRTVAARVLRGFPSTTFGLWTWLDAWHRTSPDEALAWARWAQAHAPNPALFHIRAAQYLLIREDRAGAEAEYRAALAKVHWTARPQVAGMLRDMGAKP